MPNAASSTDPNIAGVEFWSKFCDITPPVLQDGLGEKLRSLRQAAFALLDRKAATPLESVDADDAFAAAATANVAVAQEVAGYNQAVVGANGIIVKKKAATGAADMTTVEAALLQVRLTKKRHEPEVRKACDEFRKAQAEKTKIEDEKAAVKKKLDDYTQTVIGKYEQTINRLLGDFVAGFRITETKHAYPGGVASSSYQILINSTPVPLGDDKTPLGQPSFRNTLSSGDKTTLYTRRYMHGENPDAATEPISDGELLGYVKRTLDLSGSC